MCQAIVSGWGTKWDFKPMKLIRGQEIMCYSYKLKSQKKPTWVSRWDFKNYKAFLQSLHDLLSGDYEVVAHNGIGFDNKHAETQFLLHGLGVPKPYKTTDTLRWARSKYAFWSNSLGDLGEFLGLGPKEKVGNADLEDDFMTGNPTEKTNRAMKKYNNRDVTLLEQIFDIFMPGMNRRPNAGTYMQEHGVCPHCGERDYLQKRGEVPRANGLVQQWFCVKLPEKGKLGCGGWSYEASAKTGRLVNA